MEKTMSPALIFEMLARTQRQGNTTALVEACRATGAVAVCGDARQAALLRSHGAPRTVSIHGDAAAFMGLRGPYLIDAHALGGMAEAWRGDIERRDNTIAELTANLREAREEYSRLAAEASTLRAQVRHLHSVRSAARDALLKGDVEAALAVLLSGVP